MCELLLAFDYYYLLINLLVCQCQSRCRRNRWMSLGGARETSLNFIPPGDEWWSEVWRMAYSLINSVQLSSWMLVDFKAMMGKYSLELDISNCDFLCLNGNIWFLLFAEFSIPSGVCHINRRTLSAYDATQSVHKRSLRLMITFYFIFFISHKVFQFFWCAYCKQICLLLTQFDGNSKIKHEIGRRRTYHLHYSQKYIYFIYTFE